MKLTNRLYSFSMEVEDFKRNEVIFNICDTVFLLGGGGVLRDIAELVLKNKKTVKVITSPRHIKERIDDKSLEDFLIENDIEFKIFDDLVTSELKTFCGDVSQSFILSLGAAWIFNNEIIEGVFANKIVNLHGTRLPQDRGGGGHSWRILMGNRFGFITLHLINSGIDTGPIIIQEEFLYNASCRIPADFERDYSKKVLKFFEKFFADLFESPQRFPLLIQNESHSTYWPRLNTEINAWIDWSIEPKLLERFICAFDSPYLGAKTMLNNDVIRIRKVSLNYQDGVFHHFQSGIVYRKTSNWICIALNGCGLIVEELLDINGNDLISQIKVGSRFYTPIDKISESFSKKIVYNSRGQAGQ
jgi:methionyl-tRNA formyltransferase